MGLFGLGKDKTYSTKSVTTDRTNTTREFDLNIEKILENWEVYHAVREIIANALDEQVLTNTKDIQIYKSGNTWHIRDFGRGLSYHHLTQNENEEKLNNNQLIGRFGVGLKDALATFYRHNVKVVITSCNGVITLSQSSKIGFDDILTLHAVIHEAEDSSFVGTDVALSGCSDADISAAKNLFLKFSNEIILETTKFGQIIEKSGKSSTIYVNGVKVAEEPNFLFTYNITSLNKQLKKALNRERTNVGRTAYADRVKAIILASESETIIQRLADDLREFSSGRQHDELNWSDVSFHTSVNMRRLQKDTTFVTAEDLERNPDIVDQMKKDGLSPFVVSDSLLSKIEDHNENSTASETLTTAREYVKQQQASYTVEIIDPSELTASEREIFDKTDYLLSLMGGKPSCVKEIVIVKALYQGLSFTTTGQWEPSKGRISIRRTQLKSLECFAGTLLHEYAHAKSGAEDVNRDFEIQLTSIIGKLAALCTSNKTNY